jgi:hypothetical protein
VPKTQHVDFARRLARQLRDYDVQSENNGLAERRKRQSERYGAMKTKQKQMTKREMRAEARRLRQSAYRIAQQYGQSFCNTCGGPCRFGGPRDEVRNMRARATRLETKAAAS